MSKNNWINTDNNLHNNISNAINNHVYNVNTSHPIIPNSQEYMFYKKFVSIHSDDRDVLKYPSSSEFEIELPEDYLNVATIRLIQWTFPANYNTFSIQNNNIVMLFKIDTPYNPSEFGVSNILYERIFQALFETKDTTYKIIISEGFYNPLQMTTELTNKFNYEVTQRIRNYFIDKGWTTTLADFEAQGGYKRFSIVYNNVSLKIWFGNIADSFTLLNEKSIVTNAVSDSFCFNGLQRLPNSTNYGLPGYLGLSRCNTSSVYVNDGAFAPSFATFNDVTVPRFYYGDVLPGDEGYWLLPDSELTGSKVHWIEPIYKVNLMGEAFIYMELFGQNCIDETKPFNVSEFTLTTNQTNGVVNSAFAKMPVPSTPLSQWFDRESIPYKYYYPPAERIRRLKIRLRYHDGSPVEFGVFNYSFMLEFTLMVPQITRKTSNIIFPAAVGH